jgi:Domain of unknown function (DUF5671)
MANEHAARSVRAGARAVTAIRRIYIYLLAFAGLLMLVIGTANLGRVVIQLALATSRVAGAGFFREEVSRWGAAALIGLPVWLVHWWWAQRLAALSPDERASGLRRLYLYAVLAVALFAIATGVHDVLGDALDGEWGDAASALPTVAIGLVVWLFTWRVASADRAAVGEEGGSATLRRWYVYAAAVLGLFEMLRGVRQIVEDIWRTVASNGTSGGVTAGVPDSLVGLGVWLLHGAVLSARFAEFDRRSTLRSVAAFITLAVVIGATVFNLSQALYYALARIFGVERPAGIGGSLWLAASGPVSGVLVYGAAWLWAARARIEVEAPRQLGARRLYTYLVALVALAALAIGVAGLLWVVGDALTRAPETTSGDWWRDRVAAFVTATIVGLPLWLVHWKPPDAIDADEARSLSRRLYVYLVLIASSLTLLFSVAAIVYRLLSLALGAPATSSLASDLAHHLADTVVAGVLAAYHGLVLRGDARTAAAAPGVAPTEHERAQVTEAVVRLRAADGPSLAQAVAALRQQGFEVELLSETLPPARTSPPAG